MKFVSRFEDVFYSPEVYEYARQLIRAGAGQKLFLNYFGVNYNEAALVAVKLYFSFFERPAEKFFNEFCPDEKYRELIYSNWKPSKRYGFVHQGLTLGLKCYLVNNDIKINKYIHFRAKKFAWGYPRGIKLSKEDKNYPGICFEFHEKFTEEKKYYYITSVENKSKIIRDFGLEATVDLKDVGSIEYTESDLERKINLAVGNSDAVKALLLKQNNKHILEMSSFLFNRYNLYFFAPGYRFNRNTQSIYFVPKAVYYENYPLQTINLLLHKQ